MRVWRRPPGYLVFVVLGIGSVIGATAAAAVATSDDPGSKVPLYVGMGSVGVFVVLLIAYQWVGTMLAGRPDPRPVRQAGPGDPPEDVLAALTVVPGQEHLTRRAMRQMRGGAIRYQTLISALALAVVLGGILSVLGVDQAWKPFGESGMGFPLAFAPTFAILALALLTHAGRMRKAYRMSDDFFRPLALRIVSVPQLVVLPGIGDSTRLAGDTILAGRRHDRYVEIALGSRQHTVAIEGSFPPFEASASYEGTFDAGDGSPLAARLAELTPHPCWRGVEIAAGEEGLRITRGGGSDARERWAEDLWLAEELAAAAASADQ